MDLRRTTNWTTCEITTDIPLSCFCLFCSLSLSLSLLLCWMCFCFCGIFIVPTKPVSASVTTITTGSSNVWPHVDPLSSEYSRLCWLLQVCFHGTVGTVVSLWAVFISSLQKAVSLTLSWLCPGLLQLHTLPSRKIPSAQRWLQDTYSKQEIAPAVGLMHFYSFSYATHTLYEAKILTYHRLMRSPHSFCNLFLSNILPIYVIVFIASLNANVNSGILDAKNEKKNRTDSSACVCPLGWERWVNKGKKKTTRGSSGDQEALPPVGL